MSWKESYLGKPVKCWLAVQGTGSVSRHCKPMAGNKRVCSSQHYGLYKLKSADCRKTLADVGLAFLLFFGHNWEWVQNIHIVLMKTLSPGIWRGGRGRSWGKTHNPIFPAPAQPVPHVCQGDTAECWSKTLRHVSLIKEAGRVLLLWI